MGLLIRIDLTLLMYFGIPIDLTRFMYFGIM